MRTGDLKALEELAMRLRAQFPGLRIWAFGSRVRNEASEESDLDVCVVVQDLTPDARFRISDIAWEVGFERDLFISTVAFSEEMFERGPASVSPLVRAIRREGVAA